MQSATDMVCRWDAPGGAGSVFLSASTIRDLRTKAIEAFVSLPKRGVETGGLLFGREQGGRLFIQGSEEVTCEHRYGPSFTLSDADRARLADRFAQARRDGSLPVIGFYRSFTGREAVLETAERALLRERFPQGPFVFLLLQPVSAQICTASFRLCRDGEPLPEPPHTPVSFDPEQFNSALEAACEETDTQTDSEPAREIDPELAAEPAHETALEASYSSSPSPRESEFSLSLQPRLPPPYRSLAFEPDAPGIAAPDCSAPGIAVLDRSAPDRSAPERPARTRWWLPILVCLLGGIGGAVGYEFWTLARQPQWVELHLDAQPSADARALAITWDAAAPRLLSATHALLGITDGPIHLDVPLSQAQLQLGHYSYTSAHPDVELRLTLYGNGPALSGGSLRLAPAPPIAQKVAPPIAKQSATPIATHSATPPESPKPSASPSSRAVIHDVQPHIPDGIRARLPGRLEIPVEVKFNARGRVTAASSPTTGDGLRKYLAGEAVKAARQWRFAPARRAGAPTGEKTIYFTFAR